MILVTLGTQDKSFHRLLEELDKLIADKIIKDKVIVQAGHTKYESNNMEIIDFIPIEDFNDLIKKADVLITHGGVGSIMTGLKNNKKVIAVPRLKEYKEHTNNHQLQIIKNFDDNGYIIGIDDVSKIKEAYLKLKDFKPKEIKNSNKKMKKIINDYIKENLN